LVVPNESGSFQVDNYPISKFLVEELLPIVGHWPYPPPELHLMVSAVCWIRPNLIIEWGTNVGNSARIFWQTVKKFDIPCHIHSIDLPEDVEHPENVKEARGILVRDFPDISLHLGDGLEIALRILRDCPAGSRCLFFVDGDHAYESVTKELDGIMNSAPEAAILLHDTLSSLKRWPHEALRDTLKSRPGMYRVVSTDIGLPGMSFIYPVGIGCAGEPPK
jgi:cephalosporin hydroxylase